MNFFQHALEEMEGVVTTKVALEALGISNKQEQEVVIYAKINNIEGLSQASSIEHHEQAELKSDIGRVRIRKTTRNGRVPVYEMTTKKTIKVGATFSSQEQTKNINETIYNMFMDVCPTFMAKTRYTFKTEQLRIKRGDLEATIKTNALNFEVDVFTKSDGTTSEWCKIDIEIDKLAAILKENNLQVKQIKLIASISKLPFEPDTIVIADSEGKDADKEALIKALFTNEFLITKKQ